MHYTISQFAKIFGVSAESIRQYERKGIICPERDPDNNYRQYSVWDLFNLHDRMINKGFGLSLAEYLEVTNANPEAYCSMLENKMCRLEKEIEEKKMLLDWMQWWTRDIETSMLNLGRFSTQRLPEMYFLVSGSAHHGDNTELYNVDDERMQQYIALSPYYVPSLHTTQSSIVQKPSPPFIRGGIIQKKYADKFSEKLFCDHVIHLPEQIYLTYTMDVDLIGGVNRDSFISVFSFLDEANFRVSDDIFGSFLLRTKNREENHRYLKLLMPLK